MASLTSALRPTRATLRLLPITRRPIRTFVTNNLHSQVKGGQNVYVQTVRVRSRWFRPRNIAIAVGVTYFCAEIYNLLVLRPLFRWLDDEIEKLGPEAAEQPLEPLFIAFPFTTRWAESLPYSGMDPEWQEFIKIAKDQEAQEKMRKELAGVVKAVTESASLLTIKTGKDFKVRRYWLDLDYPFRPPPTVRRMGAELSEEGWSIAWRPADPGTVQLIDRVLLPKPMLQSTYTFLGSLLQQQLTDTARTLGYEPNPGPATSRFTSLENLEAKTKSGEFKELQQQATNQPEAVKDPGAALTAKRQASSLPAAHMTAVNTASSPPARPRVSGVASDNAVLPEDPDLRDSLPWHESLRLHGLKALKEAQLSYRKSWKPIHHWPPRGCPLVSGFVELETSKSFVLIEVAGWWNPKTQRYDTKSMVAKLRRVQMKKQAPLR